MSTDLKNKYSESVLERVFQNAEDHISLTSEVQFSGQVLACNGQLIESSPFPASIGSQCTIKTRHGLNVKAEIIGFKENKNLIFPYENNSEIFSGDEICLSGKNKDVEVGSELLGRVIDGLGQPLDDKGPIKSTGNMNINGEYINPFDRGEISSVLNVGIKSINALTTIGCGQRIGIIAGSGVGKSVLLSMITENSEAEVIVVGLIGERGRELATFTREITASHSNNKVVIVAVPADQSPLLRIQGAKRATSIAEYFRDEGKNVLLILDSLTRVAHAQRELGLAVGEQPTSRGYPPSVISLIPALIERTGVGIKSKGSITSIYTILKLRKLISIYQENQDLLLMGGYVQGQDADLDQAVQKWPDIVKFLHQDKHAKISLADANKMMSDLVA